MKSGSDWQEPVILFLVGVVCGLVFILKVAP
jgi:hypothetical protein